MLRPNRRQNIFAGGRMFDGAKRLQLPKIAKCGTILFKITHPTSWTDTAVRAALRDTEHEKEVGPQRTQRAQSKAKGNHERHEKHEKDRATAGRRRRPLATGNGRRNHKRVRFAVCVATPFSCRRPRSGPVAAALRALRALRSNVVVFVIFVIFVCDRDLLCSGTSGGNELPMSIGCAARRRDRSSTACRRRSRCTRARSPP